MKKRRLPIPVWIGAVVAAFTAAYFVCSVFDKEFKKMVLAGTVSGVLAGIIAGILVLIIWRVYRFYRDRVRYFRIGFVNCRARRIRRPLMEGAATIPAKSGMINLCMNILPRRAKGGRLTKCDIRLVKSRWPFAHWRTNSAIEELPIVKEFKVVELCVPSWESVGYYGCFHEEGVTIIPKQPIDWTGKEPYRFEVKVEVHTARDCFLSFRGSIDNIRQYGYARIKIDRSLPAKPEEFLTGKLIRKRDDPKPPGSSPRSPRSGL